MTIPVADVHIGMQQAAWPVAMDGTGGECRRPDLVGTFDEFRGQTICHAPDGLAGVTLGAHLARANLEPIGEIGQPAPLVVQSLIGVSVGMQLREQIDHAFGHVVADIGVRTAETCAACRGDVFQHIDARQAAAVEGAVIAVG